MHFKKKFVTLVAVALLSAPVLAAAHTNPAQANIDLALDNTIKERMSEAGIVGLGAAIIVNKKLIWAKGYGFADKAQAVAFTPDTAMNIGSISKTFTGVAMMQAVQSGKLALDEDINRYLPFKVVNPFFPEQRMTLRQLATHTSGITDRWAVYESTYRFAGDTPEPLPEFLKSYFTPGGKHYANDNFLQVKPGTHRDYSNIAAALAGYIVELATGETLHNYAQRHIFSPLQMRNSGWRLAEINPAKHAKLYVSQSGFAIPIPHYELTTYPDGGVRTSVADLSRLFIALLNGGAYDSARILEPHSVEEMLRFHYTESNKPDNVKLNEKNSGIFWSTKFNVTRIGHGGADPGVMTEMLSSLSKDVGVILFSNTSLAGPDTKAYNAIFDALWQQAELLKSKP